MTSKSFEINIIPRITIHPVSSKKCQDILQGSENATLIGLIGEQIIVCDDVYESSPIDIYFEYEPKGSYVENIVYLSNIANLIADQFSYTFPWISLDHARRFINDSFFTAMVEEPASSEPATPAKPKKKRAPKKAEPTSAPEPEPVVDEPALAEEPDDEIPFNDKDTFIEDHVKVITTDDMAEASSDTAMINF